MTDVFSRAKRSDVMSHIRSKGNKKTEIALAKLFRTHKIVGWRRQPEIFGRPDFVFCQHHLVVFVDGCFWHMCPRHFSMPKNNRSFWKRKLEANVSRDKAVTSELKQRGWEVIRLWEHQLRDGPDGSVQKIRNALRLRRGTSGRLAKSRLHSDLSR